MEDKLPRKTEKPWGFELLFAHTPHYAGKVIFVKKDHRLSLQYHKKKDETIYIYQGKALLDIEEDGSMVSRVVKPGESITVPPFTKHRLKAIEDTTFFEVSTPELDDVVRIEDDYGRA
ncbi:MAG: cupin domain-containing protein [Dehalococcoidia bacterium]|nr:MAG: cupin domain-containing protein [Dehalococcoidia bacterium]